MRPHPRNPQAIRQEIRSKFFHLRYLPEQETKWKARGLHDGNVTNHFKQSWYLTRNWKQCE